MRDRRVKTQTIEALLEPLKAAALADLARLVNINSFSGNAKGLRAVGDAIVDVAAGNGLPLSRVPFGNVEGACHLAADDAGPEGFVGVVGHFDTVHPPESPFDRLSDRGERLVGPGVQDMKSGIVAAIYGLRLPESGPDAAGRLPPSSAGAPQARWTYPWPRPV